MHTGIIQMDWIILILSLALCITTVMSDVGVKTSMKRNKPFIRNSKPQFITFESKRGDIQINWDITIPFLTIPMNHVNENGELLPLLNINTKGLSISALFVAIITLVVPLFSVPGPRTSYRSDFEWSRMGNTMNELMFGSNHVTPCIQRVVCSVISEASHMDHPSSTAKIIDGLSSNRWFNEFTNGTILQEAVKIGRERNHDCGDAYKECFVTPKIFKNMMTQFGSI